MEALHLKAIKKLSTTLIWSHVSVKTQKTYRSNSSELLNNLSGIARSGEILAIIGASGVGKTTLMNVLSGRHSQNLQITGDVYLNNTLTTALQRTTTSMIGYVEQYELFIDTMTLEEHLIFQAMLRMSRTVNDDERRLRVIDTVAQLHLNQCKTTTIGRLSGGEKKRLAFATALLTNPDVLLVDEPTSGLDTYLAKSLMNMIQSMAVKRNQAVIVVLHQPSSVILDVVNTLYLLVEGGRQAFLGSKNEAEEFFGTTCQLSSSALDGYIEQVSAPPDIADDEGMYTQKLVVEQYVLSGNAKSLETSIEDYIESIHNARMVNELNAIERSSFLRQLKWLLWRSFVSIKRSPKRTNMLIFRFVLMAFMFGAVFFQLSPTTYHYILNVDALLIILFMPLIEFNMSIIQVEVLNERKIIVWEYRRQLYSIGTYYLTRLIVDTCFHIISSTIYMAIILFLTGLSRKFLFLILAILRVMTACSMSALIAAISSTARTGLLWLQPIQNLIAVFTGYFINLRSIPAYLRWMQYLSYNYYGYRLMLIVQWHDFSNRLPCSHKPSNLLANISTRLSYSTTCSETGDDVLNCFDTSYGDTARILLLNTLLLTGFHLAAFIITIFQIRRTV